VKKNFIVIDVEANGPCPGLYSMISFGAVLVDGIFDTTFYGQVAPIAELYDEEAYKVVGTDYKTHLTYDNPQKIMEDFEKWIQASTEGRPIMWTDNVAFDWQFINYYFHAFLKRNPLGFSARRIGDFYAGIKGDLSKTSDWKKFRITRHSHHPVDDAKGNAEALWQIIYPWR
jgi:DNA polymerase III epsilon subunit-like protein